MVQRKYRSGLLIAILLLIATIIIAAIFGSANISVVTFFELIGSKIPGIKEHVVVKSTHQSILFNMRFPRIILAMFAGMGLAVAGAVFQGVFSNPMAEPYLMGVSSGAALGATIAAIFQIQIHFLSFGAMTIFAFIGAILVVMVIYRLAVVKGSLPVTVLLLSGLAINYLLNAMITLMMNLNQDQLEAVYFWTMGSFMNASWERVGFVGVVVSISLIYIMLFHKELDMIMLGDEHAKSVGVDVEKLKKRLLIISSLVTAVIVSTSGIIGFVGLIVPHGVRLVTGPTHRRLLPITIVSGGMFMIICDTIARSILENKELSIGIITSICGVPFFLWLLYKNRRSVG